MRGENEFDPQQNSEAVFSNRTVRFAACVGSVSFRANFASIRMIFCVYHIGKAKQVRFLLMPHIHKDFFKSIALYV